MDLSDMMSEHDTGAENAVIGFKKLANDFSAEKEKKA